MINLEGIANKLTNALYKDSEFDEMEKAKIEYGFSLVLGVGLTLMAALVLAALLGTIPYTLILFLSAMSLRLFSGGAHCSSYDRCMLCSLLVFVPASVLVKLLVNNLDPELLMAGFLGFLLLAVIYWLIRHKSIAVLALFINLAGLGLGWLFKRDLQWGIGFTAGTGVLVQTMMRTRPGEWFVDKVDKVLNYVGI